MKRALALAALALGLLAPSALAGGWATSGLSSLPHGTAPGEVWKTQITLMQHGRTPLENVSPAVVIKDAKGRETRFEGKPSGTPGVYDVAVRFPAAGTYTYKVDDSFGNAFSAEYAPVKIAAAPVNVANTSAPAAPVPADDGGLPLASWLLGGLAVLLAAGAGASALRRRSNAGRVQPA